MFTSDVECVYIHKDTCFNRLSSADCSGASEALENSMECSDVECVYIHKDTCFKRLSSADCGRASEARSVI